MAKDARLNITVMNSTKRRLQDYCESHNNISMGDVVDAALKNFLDRQDREYSAPDLVLERLNQVLLSNMELVTLIRKQQETIQQLNERIEHQDD